MIKQSENLLPKGVISLTHPAAHAQWLRRRTDKLRHDGRPTWQRRSLPDVKARVVALVHVYYPELLPELLELLGNISVPFDVIVTNASGMDISIDPLVLGAQLRDIRILEVENRGRDIMPMISVVNAGLLEPYDLVLKVHTKKSEWRDDHHLEGSGAQWREALLADLAGSVLRIDEIVSAFAEDPALGMVTGEGCIGGPESWGANQELTEELLKRFDLYHSPHLLRFASGSIYWTRAFILNGLRGLELDLEDFEEETGRDDGTTPHAIERAIGILCEEAGFTIREAADLPPGRVDEAFKYFAPDSPREAEARVYPFYLPQFHAFDENNEWWGQGFTEWSNVASAKPVFPGHRQPNLPGDLGFYDLDNPDVRTRQFELAQRAGIEGFMYYYYWFAGKRLMDTPIEQLVGSDKQHPFCVMWANENWTRRWDGSEENILIAQNYDRVPAENFIEDIRHLITDPRYLRVDGRPLIAIYRITQIPNYRAVIEHWRRRAEEFGLPGLELLTVDVPASMQGLEGGVLESGLDGVMEFPPHNYKWVGADTQSLQLRPGFGGNVFRYDSIVADAEVALTMGVEEYRFPGVLVNFDNTARRQDQPDLWIGANPFTFRRWLRRAVVALQGRPKERRIVFVNAWNEWAEGAVLEPTQRFGRTYLEAVRSAVFGL